MITGLTIHRQVKDTQAAQKLLLERLDPTQKGSFATQGLATLNGQSTQKTLTSGEKAGRDLDTSAEAAVERFGAPLIVLDAPSSIAVTSPASTAVYAGEQLHLITQSDSHYAAGHTLSSVSGKTTTLYTHEGGLEAVAANGPLSLQAHTDELEMLADKEITVVSVNDSISINAKTKIVLKAGQTSITLEGANITFACPGKFSVKGAAHFLDGGASSAAVLAKLPDGRAKIFKERLRAVDATSNKPVADLSYKIVLQDGSVLTGRTDEEGKTIQVATTEMETLKVYWGVDLPEENQGATSAEGC